MNKISISKSLLYAAFLGCLSATCVEGQSASRQHIFIPADGLELEDNATTYRAWVVLPTSYILHPERHYGIIVFLHEADGAEYSPVVGLDNSTDNGGTPDVSVYTLADKYERILVFPTAGSRSWYVDCPETGYQSETYLLTKVLPKIDHDYRTNGGKDRWILGYAMGGYGALYIGLAHPELFSAVGGIEPCTKPSTQSGLNMSVVMGSARKTGGFDLFTDPQIADLAKRKDLVLALADGDKDYFFWDEMSDLHNRLDAASVVYHWEALHGGKNDWNAANQLVLGMLDYFAQNAASPKPTK